MSDALITAAVESLDKAYAPYSQFPVAAAIEDEKGRIHTGVNVENAAYPNGSCAETGAIAAMVLGGGQHIIRIAIVGRGPELCTPCGGCRQRIREFANPMAEILICDETGLRQKFTLDQLLPQSFGPDNLES
jgi:cytidine deaminase